jgi:hypothetical protein
LNLKKEKRKKNIENILSRLQIKKTKKQFLAFWLFFLFSLPAGRVLPPIANAVLSIQKRIELWWFDHC